MNSRLQATDRVPEIIPKLAEGNPVASIALQLADTQGSRIDPESGQATGIGLMRWLDRLGIYGTVIERFFRACKMDAIKLLALVKANELKLVSDDEAAAIARGESPADLDDLVRQVQQLKPSFGRSAGSAKRPKDDTTGVF